MAAFIDDDMNNPHINTLVFIASIPNFDTFSIVPNFFRKFWRTFPKYRWLGISMLRGCVSDLFMCVSTLPVCFQTLVESE